MLTCRYQAFAKVQSLRRLVPLGLTRRSFAMRAEAAVPWKPILFVVVGGSFILTAVAVFARWSRARILALAAGAIVRGWIVVQLAIIGYVSWMQPTTAIVAISILALASLFCDPRASGRFKRETT